MSARNKVMFAVFGIVVLGLILLEVYSGGGTRSLVEGTTGFRPAGHFKVENSATVGAELAAEMYDGIAPGMVAGYSDSEIPAAVSYRDWRRFNRAPYHSATHGGRFVNNYANAIGAERYGRLRADEAMPPGAMLAKDSFSVTKDGDVFAGSLFLMEKLAPGGAPDLADWRYVMITPAGGIYGDTTGRNSAKVTFCHDCHKLAADNDHLYYVPKKWRVE